MSVVYRARSPYAMGGAFLLLITSLVLIGVATAQEDAWETDIGDIVYGTALSADGNTQIIGSRNNRVAVYDSAGSLVWEFAPEGTVWSVSASADGQRVAITSEDRNVYLLDGQGGQVWAFHSSHIFLDAAISADGKRVAASDENRQVYLLDGETGEMLWEYGVRDIADTVAIYSENMLVGTRDSRIALFTPDGQIVWETRLANDVVDLAVTADGSRVAAGSLDGKITLLDGVDASTLWEIDPPDPVSCGSRNRTSCLHVDISDDASRILVGTLNGKIYVLNGEDGESLQEHTLEDPISSVALSGDASTLLFGTRGGLVRAVRSAAAAAQFAAQVDAQRNLLIAVPVAVAAMAASITVLVRRTATGHRLWTRWTQRPRRTMRLMWRSRLSYILILPTIMLLLIFNYYPAGSGLYHAFTDWNPGIETKWVGLQQFEAITNSPYFFVGVKNAVILALTAFAKLTMPLLIAELIFHLRNNFLRYSMRTMFVVPLVLPSVVGILLWVNIYDPNIGLLNEVLKAVGLDSLTRSWLGDRNTALWSIITIGFPWVSPFALLIFYGGLVSISEELFDAAKVDGATWWTRFWRIDLPLLMGQVKLLLILGFIGSLQEFQSIFLTTGGGPGSVTYTPALELYYQATRFSNFGLASAMGTVLFLVILGGTILNLRYVRSQTEYQPE